MQGRGARRGVVRHVLCCVVQVFEALKPGFWSCVNCGLPESAATLLSGYLLATF